MKPSGRIFYKDWSDTIYHLVWETIGGAIDFTLTVGTPFVWGREPAGSVRDGVLYRRGVVTITRQILRPITGGYEIVAEGVSQYEDEIQMNFPCETGPTDTFTYHLNRPASDEVTAIMTDGPRWADPIDDPDVVWTDLDSGGDAVATTGTIPFEFIDVWG